MKIHFAPEKPAMTVYRRILTKERIVYLLVGRKFHRYEGGRSRIAYIGTSKRGARRIASSAAHRADEVFSKWGWRLMDVFIVSCQARPGLKSWRYLERALLARFLEQYRGLPFCNRQGRKYRFDKKLQSLFRLSKIDEILAEFDARR